MTNPFFIDVGAAAVVDFKLVYSKSTLSELSSSLLSVRVWVCVCVLSVAKIVLII